MFFRFGSKYDASLALRVGRVTPVSNRATQGDTTMSQPISDEPIYSEAIRGDRLATERRLLSDVAHLPVRFGRRLPGPMRSTVDAVDVLHWFDKKYVGVGSLLTRRFAHESWP